MSKNTEPTAIQKRATNPDFVKTFPLEALKDHLPFRFLVPQAMPSSPKRRYRSHYRYLGYDDLTVPTILATLTLFGIALRLIDFSPLRDYLAQFYYVQSAKGQVPFDSVSLFLRICLRRELNLSWRGSGQTPGRRGRNWLATSFRLPGGRYSLGLGPPLLLQHRRSRGVRSTLPPVHRPLASSQLVAKTLHLPRRPPRRGVTISHDLVLHQARSNMKCAHITDSCYQPAPRPCPAKEADKQGCDCTDEACAEACRRATPLDIEARYTHYEGHNKETDLPTQDDSRGRDVYGYASNPDRLLDDRIACAWTTRTGLYPANADERELSPPELRSPPGSLSLPQHRRDAGQPLP